MIWPITEEQRKLSKIIEPYVNGPGTIREDSPEDVKKAYKKLMEIGKKQDELMISLW